MRLPVERRRVAPLRGAGIVDPGRSLPPLARRLGVAEELEPFDAAQALSSEIRRPCVRTPGRRISLVRSHDCPGNSPAIPVNRNDRRKSAMTEFDPAAHRMVPEQRWFEDFALGERFVIPSRTMTSAVFAAFQTASGDTHPVHYDVEYCRARGLPNLLAHGFQTLIHTAPGGGLFPFLVEESLVGFLEQSSRFLKPVYADDTIYPALDVTELTPGRSTGVVVLRSTVFNQRRELVLEGSQKFLIRRRPAQT